MILIVYGGWCLTSSTDPYSWCCRSKWSSSSIHPQRRQQQRQLTICGSSSRCGNAHIVLGNGKRTSSIDYNNNSGFSLSARTLVVVVVAVVMSTAMLLLPVMSPNSDAIELIGSKQQQQRRQHLSQMEMDETLQDIPQTLSSQDDGYCSSAKAEDCKKKPRIQRPKSRKAESCTIKCVTTCIRGGGGSPGEGPLNIRRPIVVFKEGFRSRQYCLIECSDICNLINEGDSGP